jgi:hypothetical protein
MLLKKLKNVLEAVKENFEKLAEGERHGWRGNCCEKYTSTNSATGVARPEPWKAGDKSGRITVGDFY